MNNVVILANGSFPTHPIPLGILKNAQQIICCDGAAETLIANNMKPNFIIGDLDSISDKTRADYAQVLIQNKDQETNDLTKAVEFCIEHDANHLTILGATGKREDHTIGNISLLAEYCKDVNVCMISDYGTFTPIKRSTKFESFAGQQVSIFCTHQKARVTSENLKYPLNSQKLPAWWNGTLNESESDTFSLLFDRGELIVYQMFGK